MQVIDPHVHFWAPGTLHYPWLADPQTSFVGDARLLKHDYLPRDLARDADEIEIIKIVHVEANHDPADPLGETRWLQSLADAGGAGLAGWPHALVAAADLSKPEVEQVLAGHAEYANVRGIRQILNVHGNLLYDYVGRHYMHEPVWQKNFALLAHYGMSFDLQIYPSQMPDAVRLAHRHPEIQIVLNHAGMFVDRDSVAGYRAWRDGMKALAACPNVAVKISGLAMFDHHWTVESLRPYVLETLDTFGTDRAMFASNFPVDGLFGTYSALWHAYAEIVAGTSDEERERLFVGNAERIYRF